MARRRKVDGVTTAAWHRLALAHLDSAMLGRCMIHEECAATPDLGRRCFSAQMSAHLSATGQAAREQDWLWGLHCPRCKIDRRRGHLDQGDPEARLFGVCALAEFAWNHARNISGAREYKNRNAPPPKG